MSSWRNRTPREPLCNPSWLPCPAASRSHDDINYLWLTFKDAGMETGFAKSRQQKLAASMIKCSIATGVGSGVVLLMQKPWEFGREYYVSDEVMQVMQLTNLMLGSIVLTTLQVSLVFSTPCVVRRASPALLEIFSAFIVCLAMVLLLLSVPFYASKALGIDPEEHLEPKYITDTGLLLTIDALITGSHMLLPIRFCFILSVQVVGLLTYVVPALTVGAAESNNAFRLLTIFVVLVGLACTGKRGLELEERTQFLTVIREKSLRFQSDFQLSRFQQQRAHTHHDPSESGKDSLPSTTESGRVFSVNNGGITKDFMEELATIGGREQWLIRPDEITLVPGQQLGEGSFGRVFLARYQGTHVAVKVPKIRTKRLSDNSHLVELCNELRVLRRVRHPNIVLFYGAALDDQNCDMALVIDFVDGLSLRSFVRSGRRDDGDHSGSEPPSALQRSQVLVDVACALQYLHSRTPHIAHGDLKDNNVFVEAVRTRAAVRAKLLDFGLSRMLTRHVKPMGGTLSWVAPELLRTGGKATSTAADVFSFGRLAFFVITGRLPLRGTVARSFDEMVEQLLAPLEWPPGSWLAGRWQPVVEQCTRGEAAARLGMQQVYRHAADCHGALLESEPSELPLNIAQLIAGSPANVSAPATGGAGEPRRSDRALLAAAKKGAVDSGDPKSSRTTLSGYDRTPDSTAILVLLDALLSLNLQIPAQSCCEFHGSVRTAAQLISSLLQNRGNPCKHQSSLCNEGSPVIGQCSECGVLLRQGGGGGSSSALPPIVECNFCNHNQSWMAV
ncbi:unnamed protein product [Prorocentrum cordatum]|uniref:Protein kinase domain-containing protein n=1 Tax=Prorocentrum cordatum TaxID=2364126 RepID=A0ABN9UIV2_9DINO|nr:unnamed protein product [Polarella glacialis]